MSNKNRLWIYGLLSILFAMLSAGCDPHTQYGVRELQTSDKNSIVASIRYWGPGSSYDNSVSLDGGFTWDDNHYLGDRMGLQHKIEGDCNQDCIIEEPTNNSIKYRIVSGKTLYISTDSGLSWQSILYIPAWKNYQKNYVLKIHNEYVPIDNKIRGPFDVITEPYTQNLLVAMGYEGILLKTPSDEWEWIEIAGYEQMQTPTRVEMLGQIEFHLWLVALSVALLSGLINLKSLTIEKISVWKIFFICFVIFILSMITNLNSSDLSYYGEREELVYRSTAILFSAVLSYFIYEKSRTVKINLFLNKIPSLVTFYAISTFFLYMVPLLLWSQGVQIKLAYTGMIGLGASLVYIILQVFFVKNFYNKKM